METGLNLAPLLKPGEFRSAYQQGHNILRLIRDRFGLSTNEQAAILVSYDLQAGSYIKALGDAKVHSLHQRYSDAIGSVIKPLKPRSLLEAGVGEATTLLQVTKQLSDLEQVYGFDLVWSRIHCGNSYWKDKGRAASLFVGELEAIPFPDNSFDVVFTAHAVEPNRGREELILEELYRVAGKYLALFEPAYELADSEARAHMEFHGYCRNLPAIATQRGWKVVESRLLGVSLNTMNPTGVLVIEKSPKQATLDNSSKDPSIHFTCPVCRSTLLQSDHWFCRACGLVYPQIKGIPCLSRMSAIVASKFDESCPVDEEPLGPGNDTERDFGPPRGEIMTQLPMKRTVQDLYRHARTRIPGGTQLLSKRPEMFLPDEWPSYYERACGSRVWDLDGREYIDMSYNGIGCCVLGAADPDVDAAARCAIEKGTMSTLNCAEEVHLADLLCEIHPWAEMARFARSGGEAMAIAVRIARAHTGRDLVAFCGYHGWHDWYLSANLAQDSALDGHLLPGLEPAGVPRGLTGTALPFRYNRLDELEAICTQHRGALAAIVMEPIRDHKPEPGFLEGVRSLATAERAPLIFDEITAGFRLSSGGAHLRFGVEPDLAVFAKALGNGYPIAAIIGREEVMQSAQHTFISSTNWTERIGPSAALATVRKHRTFDVSSHLIAIGTIVQQGWRAAAEAAGLKVDVGGIFPLSHFGFLDEPRQVAHTLFTQLMLERGFLASKAFYATFAHTTEMAQRYLEDVSEVFEIIKFELGRGTLESRLHGPVAHSGFARLT